MAPNASPSQSTSGARDTIVVLGDHSDLGEEETDSVDSVLSDDNESAPDEALDDDDALEEVSQATKRKATSSAPKTLTAEKRRKLKTLSPLIDWPIGAEEITKRYMEILLLCKEEGLLDSTRPLLWWNHTWNPVRDKLLSILSCEFPKFKWKKRHLEHRYNIERRRYILFMSFLRQPWASYDEATDMVVSTKAVFRSFISAYPDAWWLPYRPLGNYGVYKEVFWREKRLELKMSQDSDDERDCESETGEDYHGESKDATMVP